MSRINLSSRERTLFVVSMVFLAAFGTVKLVYLPFKSRQALLAQKVERTEARLQKDLRVIQKARAYEKKHAKLIAAFSQTDTDEQAMSSILSEIEQTAMGMDIHVSDMKPQRVRKNGMTNYFSVTLGLSGQLVSITNFIYLLQSAPHLFNVEEFRLEKKSFYSDDLKCNLVLSRSLVPFGEADL